MSNETRVTSGRPDSSTAGTEQSLRPLLNQLAQDSSALIKQEIALAKAEVKESISQTANGVVKLGIAAALAGVAGLVLTAFLVLLLGDLLDNYWVSALIVGVLFAIVGAVLAMAGVKRFKEVQMAPEATIETLKDDRDWAKTEVQELKRDLTR